MSDLINHGKYSEVDTESHFHADSRGMLHRCYHSCRNSILTWGFWLGFTMGFLPEHYLWEKVWPFRLITHGLGL